MPNFTFFLLIAAFIPELAKAATTAATADEITDPLPGINFKPNFKHYSGYLQVSPTRFLFYWFVTSQGNPNTDPIIFWFNGGPGCSSVGIGLLKEIGPYLINRDGKTLRQNPFAWNKNASVVFIESPAGTGFSYASDGNYTTNDQLTATQNYQAIKEFFTKYSEFSKNSVYITGESYAGIYIPMLCELILKGQSDFQVNLEGVSIGNGLLHHEMLQSTAPHFAYTHGLIHEGFWDWFVSSACDSCLDKCDLDSFKPDTYWRAVVDSFPSSSAPIGLNQYDVRQDQCNPDPSLNSPRMLVTMAGVLPKSISQKIMKVLKKMKKDRKNILSAEEQSSNTTVAETKNACVDDSNVIAYLNSPDVRKVLHVRNESTAQNWDTCNDNLFNSDYKRNENAIDMTPFVRMIVDARVPLMLYYGDTDMICNVLHGKQFAASLGYNLTQKESPWMYKNQISGFKTIYANGFLSMVSVLGVGHLVPESSPAEASYLITQFITNKKI